MYTVLLLKYQIWW